MFARVLRLILGDQLNPGHSWFSEKRDDVLYVMMEVRQETDYVLHHAQKVIAIFAAMRDFAERLEKAGHRVRYLAIDDAENRQSIPRNLDALLAFHDVQRFEYQEADEWRLDRQLAEYGDSLDIEAVCVDPEHFYTRHYQDALSTQSSRLFHSSFRSPSTPKCSIPPKWCSESKERHAPAR